jgi:YgiT-type zinc finger domain-containing protein
MGQLFATEIIMFLCPVCHSQESREELVEEIFQIDGKYVLVDHIPATVCVRCGEETFSREITEKVRLLVHSQAKPTKSIAVEVFEFV